MRINGQFRLGSNSALENFATQRDLCVSIQFWPCGQIVVNKVLEEFSRSREILFALKRVAKTVNRRLLDRGLARVKTVLTKIKKMLIVHL